MGYMVPENDTDNQGQTEGIGASGMLTDPHHVRGDAAMIKRAVRLGWITPEQLPGAGTKVINALLKSEKAREVVSLAQTAMAMREQDERPLVEAGQQQAQGQQQSTTIIVKTDRIDEMEAEDGDGRR